MIEVPEAVRRNVVAAGADGGLPSCRGRWRTSGASGRSMLEAADRVAEMFA